MKLRYLCLVLVCLIGLSSIASASLVIENYFPSYTGSENYNHIKITATDTTHNGGQTSGTWTVPDGVTSVDVFLVGGGAGGAYGGGGGGYTTTEHAISVTPGQIININIGLGSQGYVKGEKSGNIYSGGTTSFTSSYFAYGGKSSTYNVTYQKIGDGGSGGGLPNFYTLPSTSGGSDGSGNPISYITGDLIVEGSSGQSVTTREFGVFDGIAYGAGGAGAGNGTSAYYGGGVAVGNGLDNYGGGGGGGDLNWNDSGHGGNGVIIIRYANPPYAAFSATPTISTPGTSISFTDSSTNSPTSWSWDFGDSSTSTTQNPTHSYSSTGTYTVSLTATNVYGSDTETKTDYITIGNAPVAAFSGTPTSGAPSLSVTFTDSSTNSPTSWSWNFGDGQTSTSQNPTHSYTSEGIYTVTLTATNTFGSDSETKTDYIVVSNGPTALFSASTTSTTPGTTITFTDSSTGSPTSWSWDFGDSTTSTSQNPTHSYANPGTYTVSLTVTDSNAMSDTETKTDYISIGNPPAAQFTGTPTTGANAPLDVTFTDSSTNSPTSWSWNFGDGQTSTSQNPVHTYNNNGVFTVSLTVTNPFGSDSETKTNYIGIGDPIAAFSSNTQTILVGNIVSFTDESLNNPTSWSWTFGDSTTSTEQNPLHTYNSPGTYTVALTVTNAVGTNTETKTNYISAGYAPTASFSGTPLTANVGPLDVTFTDSSTGSPTSWSWNFGDGQTSTSQNPTHRYTTSGEMTVSLTVSNIFGSDTETKTNYITVPTSMYRPRATTTIAPVSTQAMQNIITAIGGETVYIQDQGVDWTGIIGSVFGSYEDTLGTNILCLIIYALPFIAMLIMHGRIEIPLLIGIFFGIVIISQLPADFHYTAWIFIIVGIIGIFAKVFLDYKKVGWY